jgi:transposase
MSLRGVLRGFGLKVGPTTPRNFPGRIRELVAGHSTLSTVAEALLAVRCTLFEQWQKLEKQLRCMAREDRRARLLMTAPGVGTIVALTYASAIDDPGRFRSSKAVGAHFGLTPRKYQSGETDITGRISKIGDGSVRTALYEAANVILTRPVKGSTLKSWGMRLAARAGMRKAKVALPASWPWFCTACWPMERAFSPTKLQWPQPANVRRLQVRAGPKISRPQQGPVAGTMDQARPMTSQQGFATARY